MKPIIMWGLRMRRTSLLWWCFGLVVFMVVELAFYPSLHSHAEQLNQSFAQLPDSVKHLIGGSDYASPVGYLNGRVYYLVLPIMLAIMAISMGGSLLGKDEDAGTLETLLATPLSRSRLLLGKAFTGVIALSLTTLASFIAVVGMSRIVDIDIAVVRLVIASLGAYLFALSTGALAFMLTALGGRYKSSATGIAAAWALGGYVIASLTPSFNWLKLPARAFSFYYYRPMELLGSSASYWSLLILTAMIAGFSLMAWLGFRQRDLRQ